MIAGHFKNDDKGRHRRLHHAGKITRHADDGAKADAGAEQGGHGAAETRAHRQRRRENAARNARHHGEERRRQFFDEEECRRGLALDCRACLFVTGAEGRAASRDAEDGGGKAAGGGDRQHPLQRHGLGKTADTCREPQGTGAEQRAERAAANAADKHQQPVHRRFRHHRTGAEIGIAADQRQRSEARQDDGSENEAIGAGFIGLAHFLDSEDDAGERRVEGRRNARRRASENKSLRLRHAAPAGGLQHDRGANLNGRALTADGGTGEQASNGQHHLAESELQRQKSRTVRIFPQVPRGDGLRDAAAAGIGENRDREPGAERETERRDDERQQKRPFAR